MIVRWDGTAVDDHATLPTLVAATPVGKTVEVAALRDGTRRSFSITVGKLADESVAEAEEETPARVRWGLGLRDLSPTDRRQLGLDDEHGVGVASVAPAAPPTRRAWRPATSCSR